MANVVVDTCRLASTLAGQSKPKSKLKALLVLAIIIIAAAVSGYFFLIPHAPHEFSMTVSPSFFHIVAGYGHNVVVSLTRSNGFTGSVNVAVENAPSWITYQPIVIQSSDSNGTLTISTTNNAPIGSADLTITATSSGASSQTARLSVKVVGVYSVSSKYGSAIVFNTTKALDSATVQALASDTNGTLTFSQTTPFLQGLERGDVIVLTPSSSSVVPKGFLLTVLSVQQQSAGVLVQTQQATLLDAAFQIRIGATSNVTAQPSAGGIAPEGGLVAPSFDIPFIPKKTYTTGTLKLGTGDLTAEATLTFQAHFNLDWDVGWHCCSPLPAVNEFHLLLDISEQATAYLKGSAGQTLECKDPEILELFDSGPIFILPILWVNVKGTLECSASGALNQNIDLHIDQHFHAILGPTYHRGEGWDFRKDVDLHWPTPKFDIALGDGSNARIGIGPRADLTVDSIAGPYVATHVFLELDSKVPNKPVWWIDGGVDVAVGISINLFGIWKADEKWGPWDLVRLRILDASYYPPTILITAPADGTTVDLSTSAGLLTHLAATASDPQDGDLCTVTGAVTWTDSIDGPIAFGTLPSGSACNAGYQFQHLGVHHLTATATDSGGLTATATVTVTVLAPTPNVFITSPTNGTTLPSGPVYLKGYATNPPLGDLLTCDQLEWRIYQGTVPSYGYGYELKYTINGCDAQTAPVTLGTGPDVWPYTHDWQIVLVATNKWGSTAYAFVTITVTPTVSSATNLPPTVTIVSPSTEGQVFAWSNSVITIQGTATDSDGDTITSTTWYADYAGKSIVIGDGTLGPTSYTVSGICSDPAFTAPGTVTLRLVATDSAGLTAFDSKTVNLGCQKPISTIYPPLSSTQSAKASTINGVSGILTLFDSPSTFVIVRSNSRSTINALHSDSRTLTANKK